MREKLIFMTLLVVLLFSYNQSVVLADDPGITDTCRVECLDFTPPGQQVVIPVIVYNDEALGGLAVSLSFGHAPLRCGLRFHQLRRDQNHGSRSGWNIH